MRLWSLHPRYLDPKGLVALWREALLAQAVIAGRTRGYTRHPQLARFLAAPTPERHIAAYLRAVAGEAARRGYRFDVARIGAAGDVSPIDVSPIDVTRGQLAYEWQHLAAKLAARAPAWHDRVRDVADPQPHPLFRVTAGPVAGWEVAAAADR